MKTIFITIPMKNPDFLKQMHYPVDGNKELEYHGKVTFPINGILARVLKKDEIVRIIMIVNAEKENPSKTTLTKNSYLNVEKYKTELLKINENIGAKFDFISIEEPFTEDKKTYENRFKKLIATFENEMEIIADITFGQKSLPLVLFAAMHFAEKFFNAEILHIIYGQLSFDDNGKPIPNSQKICDLSSLYHLNNLTSAMESPDGKTAVKMINNFFLL